MTDAGNCLNCGLGQEAVPLLEVAFKDSDWWICPQCLPILIHKPAQLAEKLAGAEDLTAGQQGRE